MSMQGSAMMYVTVAYSTDASRPSISSRGALEERGFRDHLVEPGSMRAAQPGGVRVVRVAEDRDVRIGLRDVVGVDARDVRDHEVGRLDAVRGHEPMLRQDRLELAAHEEVDPTQQDRRHA